MFIGVFWFIIFLEVKFVLILICILRAEKPSFSVIKESPALFIEENILVAYILNIGI